MVMLTRRDLFRTIVAAGLGATGLASLTACGSGPTGASGLASSDQLSFDPLGTPIGDNADLGYAWLNYINELNARNPLFAEIYTRYLEDDDLSTYISPEVSNAS